MDEKNYCADVLVDNPMGLHGRPAALLVQIASKYESRIELSRADDPENPVDCHSILSLLVLAAAQGTKLRLCAVGSDAKEAVDEIARFFADHFNE